MHCNMAETELEDAHRILDHGWVRSPGAKTEFMRQFAKAEAMEDSCPEARGLSLRSFGLFMILCF